MKPVSELLKARPRSVKSVGPDETVFNALQLLAEHEVGALVVLQGDKLVGVVSERDYTRKIALQGKSSKETKVSEIMTREVLAVTPSTTTNECMALMSQKKIRHLPVMQGSTVVSMISIRDIMDDIIADQEETIAHLQNYIQS